MLEDNDISCLNKDISCKEINAALFAMGSFKAPGEDGYPAAFFKKNWPVVGQDLCDFLKKAWRDEQMVSSINNTLIVLIPKMDKPEFISQFCPIGLCNTIYKCLTKITANRTEPLLNKYVYPIQASFVPGRNIQDNIIIAHELTHSMKK